MLTRTTMFRKTLCAVALVTMLFALVGCAKGETGTVSVGATPLDYTFEGEQTKESVEVTATPGIEIPGYDVLYIDYGSDVMEGDFFNPDSNNVHFRISFWREGDDTAFYQSDLIAPGQHLYKLEMDETFDRGTYPMTMVYETFTTDGDYAPRNGANVNCKLVVE